MMNRINATGILNRISKGKSGHEEITVLIKRAMIGNTTLQFVLETTLPDDVKVGTPINIDGCVRGFYLRNSDGKAKVTQYFVANKISVAKGELEAVFGEKGHFNPRHDIKLYIEGKITSVLSSSEGWKSLLISLDGVREVPDIITVGFRENDRIPEFKEIQKDDRVKAVLNIRSSKKTVNGENRFFQNLMVEDLIITNRSINESNDNSISNVVESTDNFDYYEDEE